MRLLPLLLSAVAGTYAVSSSELETAIIGSLSEVASLTKNLTGQIAAFDGNLSLAIPIQTATTNLVGYIQNATTKLRTYDVNLTESEAQTLGAYTQGLAYTVNASIATLISKKAEFEKNGLGSTVVTSLQQQSNASNGLSTVIISKVPSVLESVSNAINSQIDNSLQQGISCFQGQNETCNTAIANSSRTLTAAQDSGALPKSAGERTAMVTGWVVVLGAAFMAFAVGV